MATFRLSRAEAEQRAEELAHHHLSQLDTRGWTWECGGAMPHPLDPQDHGRKVPQRWIVGVRWFTTDGGLVDGPGSIDVDVAAGTVKLVQE